MLLENIKFTCTIWYFERGNDLACWEVIEAETEQKMIYKRDLRISYLKLINKNIEKIIV